MEQARTAWVRTRLSARPRLVCTVLAALAALVAGVGVGAHYRAPDRGWVIGVSAVSPYLMLGAPVALVLFGVARRVVGAAVGAVLSAVLVLTQGPLYVATDPPASARSVVVMTANLHLGEGDAASIVSAVRRHVVDVLMLEELTPSEVLRLGAAGLDTTLPYRSVDAQGAASGTGLWSRYPLSDEQHRPNFSFEFITARVKLPGVATPPTVVALHMAGPWPDSTHWHRDIARARTVLHALEDDAATIVAGDFNATLDVAQFRDLLPGYADAAEQSGAGPTPTFPADRWYPPIIAIDHVLTRHAVATSADTLHIPRSDHRALISTIAVPRTTG